MERDSSPASEPRAIATDDEVLRTLLRLPGGAAMVGDMDLLQRVVFTDGRGRVITTLAQGESDLRLPRLAFFDSPRLQAALMAEVARLPSVRVETGCTLTGLRQDEHGVTAVVRDAAATRELRAAWLVGADGAHSAVRELLGVGFPGRGGRARWLVVDLDTDQPLPGQPHMRFACDPAGPWLSLPRPGGHRLELALSAGATDADATAPARVRELVQRVVTEPLLDAGEVRIRRAAVYDHATRAATSWRAGRVLLAGDAAHTMPPFAGQGLSAGLRDADALAWRLALAVRGLAGTGALDAWERERRAHVAAMTRLSLFVGSIVETRSRPGAAVRDVAMRGLDATPLVRRWWRAGGPKPSAALPARSVAPLLAGRSTGEGLLLPRPRVRDARGRLHDVDDVLGPEHALLLSGGAEPTWPPAALPELGWRLARVTPPGRAVAGLPVTDLTEERAQPLPVFEDVDGSVVALLERLARRLPGPGGDVVALVRPDRHLAGAVRAGDLAAALASYAATLGAPAAPVSGPPSDDRTRVLLLPGSLRSGSVTSAVLRTLALAPPRGVTVDLYEGLADLPPFDPDLDDAPPPAVADLRARAGAAGAVLVCTPEYAGALPGSLKTALEWTIGAGSLLDTRVGWVNASTSPTGAADAHASLRRVLGYAGATVVESAALAVPVSRSSVAGGLVTDAALVARLREVLDHLVDRPASPT